MLGTDGEDPDDYDERATCGEYVWDVNFGHNGPSR